MTPTVLFLIAATIGADHLVPGDHTRQLTVDERERTYLVHVPPQYDSGKPTPLVLIFHGAGTNADITVPFTGLSKKSDEAGFIAVYPNGTGAGIFLTWNAGGRQGKLAENAPDDVKFVGELLDDLESVMNVDSKRVFATGISNGGMMCYRLAAELSDRIAAIAPVAGAMAIEDAKPTRPVSIMHFHGKSDNMVPFGGPNK
ncbi:MAG: prolyl oligopeptidase family serine peptidase, partial [Planctomycetaceae bacterium]|nr:prolyl oligopeptidase family serine peptidase [Planctomycetaceae bacterium]